MKALNSLMITLLVCSLAFAGCKQVTQSVKDTFKPKPKSPEVIKPAAQAQQVTDSTSSQTTTQVTTSMTTVHVTEHSTGPVPVNKDFLTNTTALKKAEASLRNLPQYRGKEIFIYRSVHFYADGSIHIMLRHPENPAYVDNYEYQDGKWSEPKPEQLSVNDEIARGLVSLNEVNFTSVANIAKLYNEKAAQIEGAKPITNAYMAAWDKAIRWYPGTINGSRQRYSIEFNNDGTLKNFRQD